jgi:hypothetical protein
VLFDVRDRNSENYDQQEGNCSTFDMKTIFISLLFVPVLLASQSGQRTFLDALAILVGTAIPTQLVIYAVWKVKSLRTLRVAIGRMFDNLSVVSGFCLLVLCGVGIILAVVMLIRVFVVPADSWVFVTLGFLWGIMGPIFRYSELPNREQHVRGDAFRSESLFLNSKFYGRSNRASTSTIGQEIRREVGSSL